ncbi:MAG: hypothetical protein ACE366_28500 [Bradymonadia bacterium]
MTLSNKNRRHHRPGSSSQGGLTRRGLIKGMGAAAGVAFAGPFISGRASAQAPAKTPKFLIVLCASGGASIIDAAMAIRASESANAETLNCFPDAWVEDIGNFRAVKGEMPALGPIPVPVKTDQTAFVRKHQSDMMVATWTRTSVNHGIGEYRSVSGNDAWFGRTMQEAMALEYGEDFLLPNVHLLTGTGFTAPGVDATLPNWARGETVADPSLWPLSLDGIKGIDGVPDRKLVNLARRARNTRFDPATRFARVFGNSKRMQHWAHLRGDAQLGLEAEDLISKLMVFPDSPDFPLSSRGLTSSPFGDQVREKFPDYADDPLQAQAALAFLLLKYRLSVSVTFGPSFNVAVEPGTSLNGIYGGGDRELDEGSIKNPPIGFDFSHQGHRSVQGLMWDRVYNVADGLIDLLKSEEYADGESMWDHSMIYVAPDFGRSKRRPAGAIEFGSGHDLNNGIAVFSPLVNGGRVLGGVNPDTGFTHGFDPTSGAPDPGREMEEKEIYAGLVHALGIDTSGGGLPDMPVMRKA